MRRVGGAVALSLVVLTASACQSTSSSQPDLAGATPAGDAAGGRQTGIYTANQADRGDETFQQVCYECHTTSEFTASLFRRSWSGVKVHLLYDLIATTMPYSSPGSLAQQQYVDVVAYILSLIGVPAGDVELPIDPMALSELLIEPASP